MRKLLFPVLLLILTLTLCAACADGLTVETGPGLFRVRFSQPDHRFLIVHYITPAENGWFTLYSEDGNFSGESALLSSYDPCRLTVKIEAPDRKLLESAKVDYAGTPLPEGQALAFQSEYRTARIRDLHLEPAEGGFSYHFTAPGQGSLVLEYKSATQIGSVILYPDAQYVYSGTLLLPHVYNQSKVYVTVRSGRWKNAIGSGTTTRGYRFAPKVAEPAADGRLKGVIVCIDPGHQNNAAGFEDEPLGPGLHGKGSNAGGMAMGKITHRRESIVMLESAFVIRDELMRQGATVVMTREDEDRWYSNLERDGIANDAGAHVMLRLHGDAHRNTQFRGFSVHYPMNSDYAKAVADRETYRGYAQLMLDALADRCSYGPQVKRRLEGTDRFVGNNWAKMPCFLVEMGFMSNPYDDVLLSAPEYQQWLAEGFADGVYALALARGILEK